MKQIAVAVWIKDVDIKDLPTLLSTATIVEEGEDCIWVVHGEHKSAVHSVILLSASNKTLDDGEMIAELTCELVTSATKHLMED